MTAIAVIGLIATQASGAAGAGTPSADSRAQVSLQTRVSAPDTCVPRLRRAVVKRRAATWVWQDMLDHPRTRTARRAASTTSCAYLRWIRALWSERADQAFRVWVGLRVPQEAICHVFGIYCSEALAVSSCETGGTFDIKATNGQYVNIFQMGWSERRKYGWHVAGSPALVAARAAYRYFVASGSDWSPWSCKPR